MKARTSTVTTTALTTIMTPLRTSTGVLAVSPSSASCSRCLTSSTTSCASSRAFSVIASRLPRFTGVTQRGDVGWVGMENERFTRRSSLAKLGGLVVAGLGGGALVSSEEAEGGNKAVETGAVSCVLTPELTEGPYYIAGEKVRRDIREGHDGTLLTLH